MTTRLDAHLSINSAATMFEEFAARAILNGNPDLGQSLLDKVREMRAGSEALIAAGSEALIAAGEEDDDIGEGFVMPPLSLRPDDEGDEI